jgi:hypothetical protein
MDANYWKGRSAWFSFGLQRHSTWDVYSSCEDEVYLETERVAET